MIPDIQIALKQLEYPTITVWNRLEGRPRAKDFNRALKAEIRDALWMLTRQWQMGEFRGNDAGSPVSAKICVANTRLTKYRAGDGPVQPFPDEAPLEAIVEQRRIPFTIGGQKVALDLRLQMGRQWLRLLEKKNIGAGYLSAFIRKYPIQLPDPTKKDDAPVCAHKEIFSRFAAIAGRAMDGAAFYEYITSSPAHKAWDGIPIPDIGTQEVIEDTAKQFIAWFESVYLQVKKGDSDAWKPSHLEYQFACSAPDENGERIYTAEEYSSGHLDWFNLDREMGEKLDDPPDFVQAKIPRPLLLTFIPTMTTFQGMPNTRWWTLEDSLTNFGDINPSTTDLAKLLLIEFALVYANDWFLLPLTLPVASISQIKGLAVTNVFGERFWIEPAGKGPDDDWQRWSMFTTSITGRMNEPADLSLLLLPTIPTIQDGLTLEEIVFIRDEISNMVWGIESTVPMPDGSSKRGSEASVELFGYLQELINQENAANPPPSGPVVYKADIRYQLVNNVPENWIPFIPVHTRGSNREIQLQRSAMPRILKGDLQPPERVYPRTMVLNEGRDKTPKEAYFLFEEEVPRAGCHIRTSFRRTRWYGGRVVTWLGVRKETGRGEGSSGLAFDQIVPTDNFPAG